MLVLLANPQRSADIPSACRPTCILGTMGKMSVDTTVQISASLSMFVDFDRELFVSDEL